MTPERLASMREFVARGESLNITQLGALFDHIDALETALQPFAWVLIGEHRPDHENVWHSLKVYHFRDARKVLKGEEVEWATSRAP
jgi:hypothetical protein